MRLFAYIILRAVLLALGFTLFVAFGALCAFLYLMFSFQPKPDYTCSADDSLAKFLALPDGESKQFTLSELEGGSYWILLNAGKRNGNATVMPIAPRFSRIGKDTFEIGIPVEIRAMSTPLTTQARFQFDTSCKLKAVYIGDAIVPTFLDSIMCNEILRYYKTYGKYLEQASRISGIKFSENSVTLVK